MRRRVPEVARPLPAGSYHQAVMGKLRALIAVLVLACGAAVVAGSGPAFIGAVAAAHPEPGDLDGDLVKNEVDNCPTTANGTQINTDGDSEGDACDADDDNDGIPDLGGPGVPPDNCRIVANPDQLDSDGDGYGDLCPPVDSDGDGILDPDDNCVDVYNPGQEDLDGDGEGGSPRGGDACDRDDDNDQINDLVDNCPTVYNPPAIFAPPYTQADLDGDGIGSACDPDESIVGPGTGTTPGFTGGTGGAGGTGVPGATRSSDTRAPTVTITVQRRPRLADSGNSFVVKASCSEACDLDVVLAAGAKAAKKARLGNKRVVLAAGSWSLAGAGKTYVFARWKPAARKLRSGRKVAATLRLTATDAAGNKRTASKPVELRR